ncbi:MAG: hypothetical protein HPPSJP_4480 [Candidatus Hepatoplasma scabrum]|nr:MAG: hypothetical protein HPPSJP_4480 [Candidatus Hepatoplasma sp.]
MTALYKLILKTNIKSPALAFPIVTPIVFILVFVTGTNDQELTTSFFKIISIMLMQSGTFGFGFNMIALKKSIMLKRIGATKIRKWEVLTANILYGWTMLLISLVWTTSFAFILSASGYYISPVDGSTLHLNFAGVTGWGGNWGYIVLGILISILVGYSIGIMFVSLAKTDEQFAMYAMFYLFFTILLAGLLINNEIRQEIPFMVWVGYFNPTVWANSVINFGVTGVNNEELWLEIVVPILMSFLAIGVSLKTFKWD